MTAAITDEATFSDNAERANAWIGLLLEARAAVANVWVGPEEEDYLEAKRAAVEAVLADRALAWALIGHFTESLYSALPGGVDMAGLRARGWRLEQGQVTGWALRERAELGLTDDQDIPF